MARYGQPPRDPFQALQDPQSFRGGQRVKRQLADTLHTGVERVEDLFDLLATTRKHVEYYDGSPTQIPTLKPLRLKWRK